MFKKKQEEEERPAYVFECAMSCKNCGFKWEEVFSKNHEIIQEEEKVIDSFAKDTDELKCPNCESENVEVKKRSPMDTKPKRNIKPTDDKEEDK